MIKNNPFKSITLLFILISCTYKYIGKNIDDFQLNITTKKDIVRHYGKKYKRTTIPQRIPGYGRSTELHVNEIFQLEYENQGIIFKIEKIKSENDGVLVGMLFKEPYEGTFLKDIRIGDRLETIKRKYPNCIFSMKPLHNKNYSHYGVEIENHFFYTIVPDNEFNEFESLNLKKYSIDQVEVR